MPGRKGGTGKRETRREDGTEAGEIEGEKAGRRKRDRPGNKAGTGEREKGWEDGTGKREKEKDGTGKREK